MRLTVKNVVHKPLDVTIAIDGYVPVDINIHDPIGLPPLYWQVGNGGKSLLELAILPENGFLSAITLVLIEPDSVHKVDSFSMMPPSENSGFPVVNLDLWKGLDNDDFGQRFVDNFNINIQVTISPSSILLTIGESKENIHWIKCSDKFYIFTDDERNISGLFVDELTKDDIELFLEAVG